MKYVTFEHHGREQVGALDTAANRIYPLDLDGMIAVISRRAVTVPERHSGGIDVAEAHLPCADSASTSQHLLRG
jgi:hypothetical protein